MTDRIEQLTQAAENDNGISFARLMSDVGACDIESTLEKVKALNDEHFKEGSQPRIVQMKVDLDANSHEQHININSTNWFRGGFFGSTYNEYPQKLFTVTIPSACFHNQKK